MTTIRPARLTDASALAALIRDTVAVSNAPDYPPAILQRVLDSFTPETVAGQIARRWVFVAEAGEALLGTASLDGDLVRAVFVAVAGQGAGVGRLLMARIEQEARAAGVARLRVPASLTALGFYQRLGYRLTGELRDGEERGWWLECDLSPP